MGIKAAPIQATPVQTVAADGHSTFVCYCGRKDFNKVVDAAVPTHLLCRCGRVYILGDIAASRKPLYSGRG